jgi:acyl carrier protein
MLKSDIQEALVDFLEERFELVLNDDTELALDTRLYDEGYIDSLDSIVLLSFLEKTFDMAVEPQDLLDHPLNTINDMVTFVFDRTA